MNIFVARLDYSTTSEALEDVFSAYGEIASCKVIFDRDTGRSKGFGFVEMDNDEEALSAINALNGTELDGREIVVKRAEPRENSGGGGYRGGGGGDRGGRGGYDRGGSGGYDRSGGGGGRGGYQRGGGGGGYDRGGSNDY